MSEDRRHQFEVDPEVEALQRKSAMRTSFVLVLLIFVIAAAAFWYLWNWRAEQFGADVPATGRLGAGEDGAGAAGPDRSDADETGTDRTDAGGTVNVLLLGADDEGVAAAFVAAFYPDEGAVSAVALPVDTRLPWDEDAQLRDAFLEDGDVSMRVAVERLLGAPVHHVVRVEFSGFVELVDLLEGVPVRVDTEIVYRDRDGQVVFALDPGVHTLSGEEALMYVRYKGDHLEDETRRVQRQLRFLEAVGREIRAKFEWSTVQDMLRIVLNNVETDLDLVTLTRLARTAMEAREDAYSVHMLPGASADDGWRIDEGRAAALAEQVFRASSRSAAGR